MAYCTTEAVQRRLPGVDLGLFGDEGAQAAVLQDAVAAAASEVDARCRRTFAPPTAAETRQFDGSGGLLLRIADLVRLDSMALDGEVVDSAAVYPLDGPPFLWIATGRRIPCGLANVSVTGLWGYGATVPDNVCSAAACLAAADILVRLQADRSGGVKTQVTGLAREEFPAGGAYGETIRELGDTASRLLLPYRRWTAW
jgi:hypothetical protein